ncbi:hypothetical protein ACFE04_024162 [Oxalis oulophora]
MEEFIIPNHFKCPISLDLMKDPVTLSTGITYDRENIEKWLESGNFTCPVTNQVLRSFDQIPNHILRKMIQEWCVANRSNGVERIPTPRVPVSSMEVQDILYQVEMAVKRFDLIACFELVRKIKKWGFESERNKKCIIGNGGARVLAFAFSRFSTDFEKNGNLLEEILSVFQWIPLIKEEEAQFELTMASSLNCMVGFLQSEDLSKKQNSIVVIKELLCFDPKKHSQALSSISVELNQILFNFVKNPITSSITKASLMVIFHLVSYDDKTKSEFIKMGLISTLFESIINSNSKGLSEKALGVFDKLCDSNQGREEAYDNDLTMPLLVKKILRVSELATEYSVSSIWKLCKFSHENGGKSIVEALEVGCFQKLLLVLQVGFGDETKEKATELMKILNPYRIGLECIETSDFKNLKRSF